jgi:Zn-dependent protease
MIPAFPLDGSKVFRWNRGMWVLSMAFLLGMGMLIYPPLVISWALLLIVVFILSKLFFG